MKEKIKQHFNKIFADAPKTRKAIDLKQEMLQNALDKYDDMVNDGYSQEDAYQNVIGSIGDVSELFVEVEEKNLLLLSEKDRRKRALLIAVAVGLYIFAGVAFFFFAAFDSMYNNLWGRYIDFSTLGFCVGGLICIAPTIMLVYAANMYPNYTRKETRNMVEDYKEVKYMNNRDKAVKHSVNTIIWTVTVVLYFLISFDTYAWHITWVIFLIAWCVQSIVGLIFSLRSGKN